MKNDWSSDGIDWRAESMDEEMARDWLRAVHTLESREGDDVIARVFELVESNLDPPRGWRLTKRLLKLATDEYELW